jgi:hypothetical protein
MKLRITFNTNIIVNSRSIFDKINDNMSNN